MSVFCSGDKHGEHSLMTLSHDKWKEGKGLSRSDYLFLAGDFGLLFNNIPTRSEAYHLKWLNNCPWTTLVVDGNHENHPMLNALPRMQWNGGEVGIIADNILHLRRGEIFTINNKKYFVFGGARSEDKMYRKEHISWWAEEEPSGSEMQHGLDNLKAHDNKVDYIITHTAPHSVAEKYKIKLGLRNMSEYNLVSYFDIIHKTVEFKHWFFGHFHQDKKLNDRFTVVYDKVIKME